MRDTSDAADICSIIVTVMGVGGLSWQSVEYLILVAREEKRCLAFIFSGGEAYMGRSNWFLMLEFA